MLQLNDLKLLSKKRKRIGRGGDRGGTSGRGHKGQRARTGSISELKSSFEGGQMPLSRRIPKRGFYNPFRKEVKVINLAELESKFSSGATVDKISLEKQGLLKSGKNCLIKILGNGALTKKLTVCADKFSKSAVSAIEKAGGKVELIKEI